MHFTLRVAFQAGTPVDTIEVPHVTIEMETVDDLDLAMNQIRDAMVLALEEGVATEQVIPDTKAAVEGEWS